MRHSTELGQTCCESGPARCQLRGMEYRRPQSAPGSRPGADRDSLSAMAAGLEESVRHEGGSALQARARPATPTRSQHLPRLAPMQVLRWKTALIHGTEQPCFTS